MSIADSPDGLHIVIDRIATMSEAYEIKISDNQFYQLFAANSVPLETVKKFETDQ